MRWITEFGGAGTGARVDSAGGSLAAMFRNAALRALARGEGECLYERTLAGEPGGTLDELCKAACEAGALRKIADDDDQHEGTSVTLANETTFARVYWHGRRGGATLALQSLDAKTTETLAAMFAQKAPDAPPPRTLHVLGRSDGGYEPIPVGHAEVPLERGNYDNTVLAAFDRIVADLTSPTPAGRLVVLDGPPGVGKTTLVWGLVEAVRRARWIVLPPDMVRSLGDPALVTAVADMKRDRHPVVFVLEDADECLVARAADNIASISSLLNMTDGLVGRLLDLRVVATTNRPRLDIDPALLRAGRLSQHVTVAPLRPEHADAAFRRLVPDGGPPPRWEPPLPREGVPLGHVYAAARRAGWTPPRADGDGEDDDDEGLSRVGPPRSVRKRMAR